MDRSKENKAVESPAGTVPLPSLEPGVYIHAKSGRRYRLLHVARHSETLQPLVCYEALYNSNLGAFWCRPAHMWLESVNVDGKVVPRFIKEKTSQETR